MGQIFADGFESGDTSAWGGAASPPGTLVYTFNAADQLLEVEDAGQALGVYAYDGDGLRVSATSGGETVFYLRNEAGDTLAEYDGGGQLIAEYLYANGRQIGKVEPDGAGGDKVSTFHPDHLGTAMLITNDIGVVTWRGEYEPFGEPVTSTGTPDRYRFTQHELDTETNLVYAKARYYHPRIGRFLSVDPVGGNQEQPQTWNRYAYTLGNPLRLIDSNGTVEFEADEYAGAAGAAAVEKAYEEQDKLRSSLSGAVKRYYQDTFGVDLDKMLSRGQGPAVKLSSNADPFFHGRESALGRVSGGEFKLNLSQNLFAFKDEKRGVTLFQATLLHESAHWAREESGLKGGSGPAGPLGDWVRDRRQAALERVYPISRDAAVFASGDPIEGQAAEIYQWGDILTLRITNP